ncbi:PilC/PilY family type IV pilus protein [uncultured Gilvimarinus sp.]|uniref:pilus assembly protein n=1 Tax=uncultured Gilvimarinus sp. TaxID=1689143 RepID=UPI0030DD65B4
MKHLRAQLKRICRASIAISFAALSALSAHSVNAFTLSQGPLFLSKPVRPIVMLNLSSDHQLFYKAYDDYSDLDGDGNIDTGYIDGYEYYGYFESKLCYSHSGGVFNPIATTDANFHCKSGGDWSGNFLNWASMTRMDAVRKILYGGKRFKDKAGETILERAFIPTDAHSFAKFYNGDSLSDLTPYSDSSGITICNTTYFNSGQSQNTSAPPLMRIAKGNYSLWASNEGLQCHWDGEAAASNGNNSSVTGIYAEGNNPVKNSVDGKDVIVRVKACVPVSGFDSTEASQKCKTYDSGTPKPTGLLHQFGDNDDILFGLLTGSYGKRKSGGVLRKQVGEFSNEINDNGTFKKDADGGSIVDTIDRIRIARYNPSNNGYVSSDNCTYGKTSFNNGQCTNWGNPQSEIYLESLRYLAGTQSANFDSTDTSYIPNLQKAAWNKPITEDNACAPISVLQFNASTSSFDYNGGGGGELSGFSDLAPVESLDSLTNKVGSDDAGTYLVGAIDGGNTDELCTPKSVTSLSKVYGTCPDAPRLKGGYQIAGIAYHARKYGIPNSTEKVRTFGIALAPAVPKIELNLGGKSVTILPACRASDNNYNDNWQNPNGNCAIVDFKLVEQDSTGNIRSGKAYVNWEDSEQGGDYDQDMWGMLEYRANLSAGTIDVSTRVMAVSTDFPMGFGYVISGVEEPGFKVHSGVNNFEYGENCTRKDGSPNWTECKCKKPKWENGNLNHYTGSEWNWPNTEQCDIDATTESYTVTGSEGAIMKQPLEYAALWGGYPDKKADGSENNAPINGQNDTYLPARNPAELERRLEVALTQVAEGIGSAASVAANSTRLGTDSMVFQAAFDTQNWSGDLKAFEIKRSDSTTTISSTASWNAADKIGTPNSRSIYTYNPESEAVVSFDWSELSQDQKDALNMGPAGLPDNLGAERVDWTRGASHSALRDRTAEGKRLLGDIVNADPVFVGGQDYGFVQSGYRGYVNTTKADAEPMVYVNANDGMLHAFRVSDGVEQFAFIPSINYDKLAQRSYTNFGAFSNNHKYLLDGQIFVGDFKVDGSWRTILVSAFGGGGKGLFALDITDGFDPQTDFLFELTGDDYPFIGNVMGRPIVSPMKDGSWALIFGNGYNSDNAVSGLVVANLADPKNPDVKFINTGVGGDNGLAEPAISLVAAGTAQYAYGGDLKGNLWRFDLDDVAGEGSAKKLFQATNDDGDPQPITASPVLGINPLIFRERDDVTDIVNMVYFGTGSYMTNTDPLNQDMQAFYAVADLDKEIDKGSMYLKKYTQSDATRVVGGGVEKENEVVDWSEKDGWYLKFDKESGERVVEKPTLIFDRLIFPTVIPSESPCAYGGSSWIMELVGVGQLYNNHSTLEDQGSRNDSLVQLSDVILDKNAKDGGTIVKQKSDGELEAIEAVFPGSAFGRQSWRQVK